MKRYIFCITVLLILFSRICFAHPPYAIVLDYNLEEKKLHFEVLHVTREDFKEHYIRKMVISVNSQEIKTIYSNKQTEMEKHLEDVQLEAQAGDTIQVKAFCSQGGTKEAFLIVAEAADEKSIPEEGGKSENR